ncbi:alanine racemase [Streptomyces rectiviolaceus]|uniref:alanine racemase n=1 Tax=Streptomyces rectiviolaceus TaxID=332591 RepID=UPI0031E146B4
MTGEGAVFRPRLQRHSESEAADEGVRRGNAYGHGLLPCAKTFRRAGVPWLATAHPSDALSLRQAGDTGRLLAWLWAPGDPFEEAVAADVDISVSDLHQLSEVVGAARRVGRPARVHLEFDTGMARGGSARGQWGALADAMVRARAAGSVVVAGLWSHLAMAHAPDHPSVAEQCAQFSRALALTAGVGIQGAVRHLAASAANAALPDTRLDAVRTGSALYGLSSSHLRFAPPHCATRGALTFRSRLCGVKQLPAGGAVGYGLTYRSGTRTTLGLVPVGYADGLPWRASNGAEVWAAGRRRPVVGAISMDQLVIDLHGDHPPSGSDVIVFGPGTQGEPTLGEWAQAAGTTPYELICQISPSLPRHHTPPLPAVSR